MTWSRSGPAPPGGRGRQACRWRPSGRDRRGRALRSPGSTTSVVSKSLLTTAQALAEVQRIPGAAQGGHRVAGRRCGCSGRHDELINGVSGACPLAGAVNPSRVTASPGAGLAPRSLCLPSGAECVPEAINKQFGLGDRWEVSPDRMLVPRRDPAVALGKLPGRLRKWDALAAEDAHRRRCRRGIVRRQRCVWSVAGRPVRKQRRGDRSGHPVERPMAEETNPSFPSLRRWGRWG